MHLRTSRVIALASGLCVAVSALHAQTIDPDLSQFIGAIPDARVPVGPEFAYFDQRIQLGVYPAMVAVYSEGGGPRADLVAVLGAAGVEGAEAQASTVPGWTYFRLPMHARTADAAANAVNTLARAADMASLVYLGETGLPVIPTRDLLIMFAPETTQAEQQAILDQHGATLVQRDALGSPGLVLARTAHRTGADMLRTALQIHDHPGVDWAQADRIFWARRMQTPNDPLFPQQWALEQPNNEDMDALDAWAVTTGDASIRVIVLDSGIEQNHPDLNQIPGQSFTGGGANGGPSNSCDNHGTAVAGCIAATINNSFGVVGIAPGVQVQSGKIFNEINFFNLFCLPFLESQDSWSAAGINWAANSGAQITNSSWGGGSASPAIANAFDTTHAQGVIHFGAAGNDGTGTIGFPANLDSVLAVAALDSSGNRAGFSTYGPGLFISAPGAAVLTTDRSGSAGYGPNAWTTIDGTSFASPYAAGVAALVLSVDPALSPEQVADILAATAVDKGEPGYDTGYGWGFIKAGAAVQAAAGSGCAPDLTGDGSLNFFDLAAYLDLYNAGSPAADIAAPLGVLNFFDLAAYLDLYNAGCP